MEPPKDEPILLWQFGFLVLFSLHCFTVLVDVDCLVFTFLHLFVWELELVSFYLFSLLAKLPNQQLSVGQVLTLQVLVQPEFRYSGFVICGLNSFSTHYYPIFGFGFIWSLASLSVIWLKHGMKNKLFCKLQFLLVNTVSFFFEDFIWFFLDRPFCSSCFLVLRVTVVSCSTYRIEQTIGSFGFYTWIVQRSIPRWFSGLTAYDHYQILLTQCIAGVFFNGFRF